MAPFSARRLAWMAGLAFCILLPTGCGSQERTVRELVAESADLPGARTSPNAALRAEIGRIVAEGGTPQQLVATLPPDDQNVAAALVKVFDRTLLPSILSTSDEFFPAERFEFDAVELRRAIAFRDAHRRQLDAVIAALARPACDFGVEFDKGYFFEERFVDEVAVACRLLAFDAAAEMDERGPAAALRPVGLLFRLIGHLDDAQLLSARATAASLRYEALRVLEAVAQHRQTTSDDLHALHRIVMQQLESWPSDADALFGERALVLHTYEAIRCGLLAWVLTPDEKRTFRQERILEELDGVLHKTADTDELYYLRAIRAQIAACDRPYIERMDTFVAQEESLRAKRSKPDFPFAAARLFLPDLEDFQNKFAVDRARCEAWALALAAAADLPSPPFTESPRSGVAYQVTRESQRVVVAMGEPDGWEAVVPLR